MRRRSIIGSVVGAAVVAGVGIWLLYTESRPAPSKTADEIKLPGRTSTIVLPVVASLKDLQDRINKEVPSTLYAVDEDRKACVPETRTRICTDLGGLWGDCHNWLVTTATPAIDCHITGQVTRGAISLSGSNQTLSLSVPVSASITVKGRGEIGKRISETATGSATVSAAIQADISEAWDPKVAVIPAFKWDNPIGVDVLGFRITFTNKVDPEIAKALNQLQAKLPELVQGLKLRENASKAWEQGFTTVQISQTPEAWMRFTPKAVGYSGYQVQDGAVRLSLLASADIETFLGQRPAEPEKSPLPPLVRNLPQAGFQVHLPITLEYEALKQEITRALKVGEMQILDVPKFGEVQVTVQDVDIYQATGNMLAVGIKIDANPPTSIIDTKGWIWLTGSVGVDNAAKRLTVSALNVYGKTDSDVVDLLTTIVQVGPVNSAIREALSKDFSKEYEKAIADGNALMKKQINDDLYVDGVLYHVDADRVLAGPSFLLVELSAEGSAALGLGKLPH